MPGKKTVQRYDNTMILTDKDVLKEIKDNNIKITPFNKSNLEGSSYDLTLDNKFKFFKRVRSFPIKDDSDYKKITQMKTMKKLILNPGEFVLGITKERIKLSGDIAGWLSGRSRFARLGLLVHITANFVHPGVNNKQVLEIYNASPIPLEIYPGTRICQIIFERCSGSEKYKGKFATQTTF
jgi:dCTP deaminase